MRERESHRELTKIIQPSNPARFHNNPNKSHSEIELLFQASTGHWTTSPLKIQILPLTLLPPKPIEPTNMRIQQFLTILALVVATEARRAVPPVVVPKKAFGIHSPYCFGQNDHLPTDKPDDKKVKEVKAGVFRPVQ